MEPYLFVQRDKESSVYTAVAKHLKERGDWKQQPRDATRFNLMLGDRNRLPWHKLGQIPGITQVVNYYRGSEVLCRKTSMAKILKEHCQKSKQLDFPWLPKSFVLRPKFNPSASASRDKPSARQHTVQRTDEREVLRQCMQSNPSYIWIAKISAGAKGEGIVISPDVEALIRFVDSQPSAYVCQQYIDRPLFLTHRRKFDIRCWVLLDLFYNVYLYREGVLRTASDPYTTDLSHLTAHLTNHSLQQERSENFGKYEEGNEMFFKEFDRYLGSTHGVSLESSVLPQIRTITRTCFLIIQDHINTGSCGYWSFQLFGLDFILDENLKVWLLEINGAPACASKLLPEMVRCLVETAVDPAFPPQVRLHYKENLFERI